MIDMLNKNSGINYFGASLTKKNDDSLYYIKGILQEIKGKEKKKLESGIKYHKRQISTCEKIITNINKVLKKRGSRLTKI